jgi:methylated-DNA-[protein]-cysteine S-methyltransferase
VLEACRGIPYGRTTTYAELAAKAGNPRAARAAGSAMSHNPIPIIIPCHRVLHTGGGLGGFSAPGGLSLKERLLAMERGGK